MIFSYGNEKYLLIVVEGDLFIKSKIRESITAKNRNFFPFLPFIRILFLQPVLLSSVFLLVTLLFCCLSQEMLRL